MLKLLIAEDEIKELEWLSTYIKEHHSERLTVVGECTDGAGPGNGYPTVSL